MSESVSSLPRRAKRPSKRHEHIKDRAVKMPDGTAVMQRWAEERRARAEEQAGPEDTTVDELDSGDTEVEGEPTVDAPAHQQDSESYSSLSRFSDGAFYHGSNEGDGSDICYEADDEELVAVNPSMIQETDLDDEDNSPIIIDSGSETSIVIDLSIANQLTAAIIRDVMKPLTAGELDQIKSAVAPTGNSYDIVITMGKDSLQRQSIRRLQPDIWLNDEVMNLVNKHITSQTFARLCNAVTGQKPSYVMSTYFLQGLFDLKNKDISKRRKVNYQNVKTWANKVKVVDGDLFELDFLHLPLNIDNIHWTLVTVSFTDKLIVYYDSMHGEDPVIAYGVFEYLQHHHLEKHGDNFDIDSWRVILKPTGDEFTTHYSSYPMQKNDVDCGVFVIMFITFVTLRLPLLFTEQNMPQIRQRLLLSILNKKPLVDLVDMLRHRQSSSVASAFNDQKDTSITEPSTPNERALKRTKHDSETVPDIVYTPRNNGIELQTPPRNNFFLEDGGGKMTQEEESDNQLIGKVFDIGLLMQSRGEVGISMRIHTPVPPSDDDDPDSPTKYTYTYPVDFDSLDYRQRLFLIELVKEVFDGQLAGGRFVLSDEELVYADSIGFQHLDLLSVANFASLYLADLMSISESYYQQFNPVRDSSSVSPSHPRHAHPSSDCSAANAPTPVIANSIKNKKDKAPSSPNLHPITVHDINLSSPMRDVIANRPPKELNKHFMEQRETDDNHTFVELKSEGEFVVPVTREEFDDLIDVNADTDADGDVSVSYLGWKSQPSKFIRTTKLNRLLMKDTRFANHIDARFDRSGRVSSAVNVKNKDKKKRPSRASHNWAVWQHGRCSHHQNENIPCPCTFEFGFELADINDLYRESRETIRMSGVIYRNCHHERYKLYDRCAGIDRQQLRREYAFSNSEYTGVDSKELYNNHKPGHHLENKPQSQFYASNKSAAKVTVRSRKVARNIKAEAYLELMEEYGFTKGDTLSNLYSAAQLCKEQDLNNRKKLLQQHGESVKDYVCDEHYLGILRKHNYEDVTGNRGTTPLFIQYFSKNSVLIYHEICKHGRGVIHIDGTKSRANLGATVKDGDKIQMWQMILSLASAQKSHPNLDPRRFVRQNISPKLLSEAHMTNTATADMTDFMTRFFHAQWLLCGDFVCPLVVKTDCAKGLCAAVFMSLTLDDAPVATRITYNNLMLVVLAHSASSSWSESMLKDVLSFVLTLIPCLYSLCRPHAIRAAYHWVGDKKRSALVRNNRQVFKELVVNWLRHCTCTISVSESIVNAAIIIYTLEMRSVYVLKSSVIPPDGSSPPEVLGMINDKLEHFIAKAVELVQRELAEGYADLKSLTSVNGRFYQTVPKVREIIQMAKDAQLQTTYTYVTGEVDGSVIVETTIFCGYYPDLPPKQMRPTDEHFRGPRAITYTTQAMRTKLVKQEIESLNTSVFSMMNPAFEQSVANYLYDEWVKVIPSLSGDIPRLCRLALEAEVDNSNQMSEAGFKMSKQNKARREYEKNAGTFTIYLWKRDLDESSLLMNDLEHLPIRVKDHNERRARRHFQRKATDQQYDEVEQSKDIPWGEKKKAIVKIRDELNEYIARNPARCGWNKKEIHGCLSSFFAEQQPVPVPFVSKVTLDKFLTGKTNNPKFNTKQMETFIAFMRDQDVVGSSTVSEIHSSGLRPRPCDDLNPDSILRNNIWSREEDPVEMDVDGFDDDTATVSKLNVAPIEEWDDDMKSYDTDISGSYESLFDDENHNTHEEDCGEDEEDTDINLHGEVETFDIAPMVGVTMYNYDNFGHLAEGIMRYRKKWSVLDQYRQIPERVRCLIMDHARKCLEDRNYSESWASTLSTPLTYMELTDEECFGDEPYMDARDEVVRERKFPGVNMSPNISAMNGSWSMALRPNLDDRLEREILERLENSIPSEIYPVSDECGNVDVDRVLRANHDLPWLDDLRRYMSKGCANGAENNRQPVRRTVSVVLGCEYDIKDPVHSGEEKRKVLDMHVYTCREMPPDAWMSRPMTNMEYAAMMIIWSKCWPYLPRFSRMNPPNCFQYCIYQRVLRKQMGKHRDNFHRRDLKILSDSRDAKLPENGTWTGVRNSQVKGSAVIVYSMGNSPMYMMFSRLSAGGRADQEKEEYVVEPTFCFRFERGWICILDCIDDLLMMHSLTFEGIKESGNPDENVRVAMVIRLLGTVGQFYCDTATMRLTGQSLKYAGKDKTPSGVTRNVYT